MNAELTAAYAEWKEANADASRALFSMLSVDIEDPRYDVMHAAYAKAAAQRRRIGKRISKLSKSIVSDVKRVMATVGY